LKRTPKIDTIQFRWPEVALTNKRGKIITGKNAGVEHVNFNCEALITIGDSLYLFTKEWKEKRCTRVFSLPKLPGIHIARFKSTFPTKVLVTGATFNIQKNLLVLCGYNLWLRPFLLMFPDVEGTEFFKGSFIKRKVGLPFRQVEGVGSTDGTRFLLINEDFRFLFLHTQPGLHLLKI
jgi:hypothetical protein